MIVRIQIALLAVFLWSSTSMAAALSISDEERILLGIKVEEVALLKEAGTGILTMRVSFSPDGERVIKTPLPGILERIFVAEGDRVKAGDPLMLVRSPEFVGLQRDFLKARADLRLAKAAFERDRKLKDAGSVSDRRWQETQFRYETARAEYAGYSGQLALAGFSESRLQKLAGDAKISPDMALLSPVDGIVLERPAMLGDQLDGNELLVHIGEPDKLVLEAILAKSAAAHMSEGSRIRLLGSESRAVIVYISSVLDPTSQTVHLRAIPDQSAGLAAGELTRWEVLSDEPTLTVPASAVVKIDGEDLVFLAVPGGFDPRIVKVRATSGDNWIVLNGLLPQDQVAVSGTAVLKGMSMGVGGGRRLMSLAGLIRFSLTQRLLMLLLVALLVPTGWWAFRSIPIDAFPDISPTQVKIIMKAPGMTPEEVESRITRIIEVELLGVPRQTMLRSIAKYALTDITVDFEEGTDIYWARQQVTERLTAVQDALPEGISGGLAPMSTPLSEMYMFTVDSPQLSLSERRYLLDWVIRPALRTVPGVADVNALGGLVKTYGVAPRDDAMLAMDITTQDLVRALELNNQNDGAGRLRRGEEAMLVRSEGAFDSIESIALTPVKFREGRLITIGMVADVSLSSLERYGAVTGSNERRETEEVVEGLVVSLRGANARDVINGIEQKLEEVKSGLPGHVSINVFYDRSLLVNRAISTVSKALVEAVILVLILLGLFLGKLRSAFTVALILPLSALVTFIAMHFTGLSANLMSLGGLAIAIGLLVDAAVVVVENIVTGMAGSNRSKLPRLHIIYRAVNDVAVPVTSGILIIILVFLPLLSLQGLEGKLFRPVALTIVYALAGSLVLSLTVIPVLASYLITPGIHEEPWLPRRLAALYQPMLDKALDQQKLVFAIAATLLLAALVAFPFVGRTFMPAMDEGDVIVQLEKLPSINLETSISLDQAVERALLAQVPEIKRIVARTGSDELGMDPMSLNETDVFLELEPVDKWRMDSKAELEEAIREVLDGFKGINYGFTQPIDMRVSEMLTGSRGDLAVKIFGQDLAVLNELARQAAAVLEDIDGSTDVLTGVNEGMQYVVLRPDREMMGRYGVSVQQVLDHVKALVEGLPAGIVIEGSARVPITLRYPQVDGDPLEKFSRELFNLPDGGHVPLSSLVLAQRLEGPVSVKREQGLRFVVITANVKNRDLVGFVEEAQQKISNGLVLPAGVYLEWGGEFENQQRAARRLMMVVPAAVVLIFLLLFSTFRSVIQATLVLANVPLALIGGVLALAISGQYLSVPASVGFIALMGIAVLNGVVMMTYFNQLRSRGMPLDEVVRIGSLRRLRPVLMTASIAALGLVPLLFVSGPGSEIQKPLAVVVIGGLVTSTALTLFILPVLYRRFTRPDTP